MPTFPTYHGPPLPEVLSPLKPGHYWLLFKWIFFQPSRLLHYLHKADPELYMQQDSRAIVSTLRLAAYRNLFLIALLLHLVLNILVVTTTNAALGGEPLEAFSLLHGLQTPTFLYLWRPGL